MKLITTDAQLRAHIPNIIASVKGETPFIERVAHFLDLAEDWVRTTFTSESTFNTICGYTDSNEIKIICSRLVVADALRRAIPSLDIVLTPNGFGVVNTSNLAPASKPRVDRLVGSMLAHRDDCIAALLPEIVGAANGSLPTGQTSSARHFSLTSASAMLSGEPPAPVGKSISNSAHRS